uniref:Phosphoglucomutase/phosphomannomutase (Pmm-pgm) n=1 Tax=uncultured marine thaumarchaeote KM3_90_G11 TaxID=1456344 RepID=A0A075HYH7_9ARCH|nr:phosphoglucomutase/phosphomannomutase (pmm-pgm) [uncultured marine thaumarchaeote KM3_90_G11]
MAGLTISGLRGIIGEDLFANDILEVVCNFIDSTGIKSCAIGRDTRSTSDMIHQVVISCLLSKGCNVEDLGVTSTPAVFRQVKKKDLDGGICITSSHNPKEWNGLKLIIRPGRIIKPDELKNQVNTNNSFAGTRRELDACYYDDLTEFFGNGGFHGLKVAMDLGGGAACEFVKELFIKLGISVYTINDTSGAFNRIIDPTEDSLKSLSKLIVDNACNVGFAFDADVDRLAILNEKGEKTPPDFSLLAGIKYVEQKFGLDKAAISIDSSLSIINYLKRINCEIITTPVGEISVLEKIQSEGCQLGGEGSSGGFIYPEFNLCRDGILLALMVSRLVEINGSIENLFRDIENFKQKRIKIKTDPKNFIFVREKFEKMQDVTLIDGIKISPNENSWVLIRPSNTEKCIRLSVEAKNDNEASELIEKYEGKINEIIKNSSH